MDQKWYYIAHNGQQSMITGLQIRAARAALRWSAETLSKKARVGIQTIKRFEAADDVPPSRSSTLLEVQAALESAGIEFIGSPADRPGIRLAVSQAGPRKPRIRIR
jgi:transcriptional regulator with XRE-family HTH domain